LKYLKDIVSIESPKMDKLNENLVDVNENIKLIMNEISTLRKEYLTLLIEIQKSTYLTTCSISTILQNNVIPQIDAMIKRSSNLPSTGEKAPYINVEAKAINKGVPIRAIVDAEQLLIKFKLEGTILEKDIMLKDLADEKSILEKSFRELKTSLIPKDSERIKEMKEVSDLLRLETENSGFLSRIYRNNPLLISATVGSIIAVGCKGAFNLALQTKYGSDLQIDTSSLLILGSLTGGLLQTGASAAKTLLAMPLGSSEISQTLTRKDSYKTATQIIRDFINSDFAGEL
jgi:hypothetical protein